MAKKNIWNIHVNDDTHTVVTRHADPDERWDADSTSTSHSIGSIEVVKESGYRDFSVGFKPKKNQPYYLLYVVYSTGDSFSHHEGAIEYVGLFQNEKIATKNEKAISKHYKEKKDDYTVTLVDDDGNKYDIHAPWTGYFESLTYVEVAAVYLE